MARCSIKRTRRKALFGESLASAGITAAATLAAAGIGAKAASDAAQTQAQASTAAARKQADALIAQNENANENQKEMINFQREQNELQRQDYNRMMTNLQMVAGQQNDDARLEAIKIQVKNGGKKSDRRSLRGKSQIPLRASSNMGFSVTDGGGVVPIGVTPEGYDVYEILGDNHEQYHKTPSGKYKTGVGFKFEDGTVVEGEGGKKQNGGELLVTTPSDAYFISKHSIKGFNPKEAVMDGMDPMDAFAVQENIKDMYNISDSGEAKYGRRMSLRPRAWNGLQWANFAGSGISTLGNLAGAYISTIGNNRAADIAASAAATAGDIMGNAYSNLKTIDPSIISSKDFRSGHMLPALQTRRSTLGGARAALERSRDRLLSAARRGNLSSANEQSLANRVESNYIDNSNIISGKEEELKNAISANNMKSINEASKYNLYADTQGRNAYTNARLNLAMYNNNLENERTLGRANALATASGLGAQAKADAITANSTAWGNAITSSAGGIANMLNMNSKMDFDVQQARDKYDADIRTTLAGADTNSKIEYVATNIRGKDKQFAREFGIDLLRSLTPGSDAYNRLSKVLGLTFTSAKYGKHIRRSLKR